MTAVTHHPVSGGHPDESESFQGRFVSGVLDADLAARE